MLSYLLPGSRHSVSVAQAMTYSKAQKLNYATQKYECFFPLRVVGLAYELGQKLAEKRGACGGFCHAPYFHTIPATVTPQEKKLQLGRRLVVNANACELFAGCSRICSKASACAAHGDRSAFRTAR